MRRRNEHRGYFIYLILFFGLFGVMFLGSVTAFTKRVMSWLLEAGLDWNLAELLWLMGCALVCGLATWLILHLARAKRPANMP